MPAKLYNRSSGKWVNAEDADIDSLVADGSHAFESGIDVPVVAKDGELGSIPSEKVQDAFKSGNFRWSTPQDTRAFEERENENILQENFDDPAGAAASGILRGLTLGVSDIALQGIGEAWKGKGADVKEALNQRREQNPKASITGEIIGSLVGAPELAIKAAKEAGLIAKSVAGGTTAGRIARTAGQQASEGLIYGLGEGITEASLGNPDEVAENLASSVALGGLFGGAFGGMFGAGKEIAPSAKAFVSKTYAAIDDTFKQTNRKAIAALGDKLLEKEDSAVLREFLSDPDLAKMVGQGDDVKWEKLKGEFEDGRKILESEAADIRKGLDAHLSTEPKTVREFIDKVLLPQADGNIQHAVNNLDNQINANEAQIVGALKESGEMATASLDSHFDRTMGLVAALKKTGNSKAVKLANSIDATIKAERSARGLIADDTFISAAQRRAKGLDSEVRQGVGPIANPFTAADERKIMLEARKSAMEAAGGHSGVEEVRNLLNKYVDDTTKLMHANEHFGVAQRKLDEFNGAYESMRKFLTGTKKVGEKNVKQSILNKLLTDQRAARDYDEVMTNIAEIAPEMEAFRKAGKDAIAKQTALEALTAKLDTLRASGAARGERMSLDQYDEFLTALDAPPDLLDRLERLKSLQGTLQTSSNAPATNMLAVLKALGHPISELQEKILSKGDMFEKLEKHFGKRHDPNTVEKLIRLAIKRPIRAATGALVGGALSETGGGGVFGDTTGAILGTAAAATISPRFVLKNLAKIERASQQATERSAKAVNAAIDALTSDKLKKAHKAIFVTHGMENLRDRRKTFRERADYTTSMANDPVRLADEFENRFGSMEHTPVVAASMMSQFTKTAQFLDSKLPKDPLAGQYLSGFHSKWQPSDFQLAQYERYVRAAEDPISVIEDLTRGKISPEAVETLKTLNPKMFADLQQGVTDAIMDPKANLSYKQKLMVGTLFELPADPTLTANFINTMQSTYQEQSQTGQAQPGMSPKKSVHIDINPEAIATETTRISN